MGAYIISPEAYRDLDSIVEYYADKNPSYAESLLDKLTRLFEQLVDQPLRGKSRNKLASGLRSVFVDPYVVYYRPSDDGVQIVRIIHASRKVSRKMFG